MRATHDSKHRWTSGPLWFSWRTPAAGERNNTTGKYFKRGSTSEYNIVIGYRTFARELCVKLNRKTNVPTSPLYWTPCALCGLYYSFFSHDTMTPQWEPKQKKRKVIFVVKFALSVCVFMVVTYLLSQLPNHTPHPKLTTTSWNNLLNNSTKIIGWNKRISGPKHDHWREINACLE